MAVEIIRLVGEDALYVAQNMRENDAREVYATRWDESPWRFAVECAALPGLAWCALLDGEPAGMGGVALHQPGIGQAWMVGTDKFKHVALSATRFGRDVIKRMLRDDSGVNRIQAFSAAFHTESHEWLKRVGLNEVAPLPQYGKGGEDFLIFYGLRKG